MANDNIDSIDREQDSSVTQVYHYHNDQLGTPNELTNDRGEVVWLADYQAWGNTAKVVWREQLIDQMQVSQDELQPIRFQGQYFDEETGLHYNRFRYYDPDVGMFTTRDPIGLMGGDNVFAYAPNPTGWIDPLGLLSESVRNCVCDLMKENNYNTDMALYSAQKLRRSIGWDDKVARPCENYLTAYSEVSSGRVDPIIMFGGIALHNSMKFLPDFIRKTSPYSQEAVDAQIEGNLDGSKKKDWRQACEGRNCVFT